MCRYQRHPFATNCVKIDSFEKRDSRIRCLVARQRNRKTRDVEWERQRAVIWFRYDIYSIREKSEFFDVTDSSLSIALLCRLIFFRLYSTRLYIICEYNFLDFRVEIYFNENLKFDSCIELINYLANHIKMLSRFIKLLNYYLCLSC